MGYYIQTTRSNVLIRKERFEEAYQALCELNKRDELKTGGGYTKERGRWYTFSGMDENYPEKCKTLEDILTALGFEVLPDADGNIVGLHYDAKSGDEGAFLEALAPFGSGFIAWRGEDGETWVTEFDGTEEPSPSAGRQLYDHETPRYRGWLSEVDVAPDDVVRARLKWVLDALYGVGDGMLDGTPRDIDPNKEWNGDALESIGQDLEYFAPSPQDVSPESFPQDEKASDIDAGELATLARNGDERAQAMLEGDDEAEQDAADEARAKAQGRCLDCGAIGETIGHQTCQYPQEH